VRPIVFPFSPLTCLPVGISSRLNGETAAARLMRLKIWRASWIACALTATWLGAVQQIAILRPSVTTPSARVADAFSAFHLEMVTVVKKHHLALPPALTEAKFNTRSSANAIVASVFSAAAADAAVPLDVAAPSEQYLGGELRYLKDYVYSESLPPDKPARIALAALSHTPLGTPIQEIERAADAFGIDAKFMKAVAKIESDFNPRVRTGSYVGLFQLSKSEFRKYGSGDILNPRANAMAAADKFVTEAALFETITHKKLTFADRYLIHQQGWEGAAEHVSHPRQLAWKSMCATHEGIAKGEEWCKRAIWGNTLPAVKREWKSVDRLTSGAFVAMWRERIEALYTRYAGPRPRRPEA
jgi:hypothetical protein